MEFKQPVLKVEIVEARPTSACRMASIEGAEVVLQATRSGPVYRESQARLEVWWAGLFHVTAPSGEPSQKEFLGQTCANPFGGANRKISEHEPGATIGLGIVKV